MDYLLIISGAGRNVGKTTLACRLIEKYKKQVPLTGVKISAHFHDLTPFQKIVIHKEGLVISEELDRLSSKDSSRYLQAGAQHSFYIQSTAENIPLVHQWMRKNLKGLVICESASLGSHVIPDQAVFVSGTDSEKQPVWHYSFQTTFLSKGNFIPEITIPESSIQHNIPMITFNEALQIISNNTKPLDTETIPLAGSLNRVLAEDIFSDIDLPPFNKSAMDGFACKRADLPGPLKVMDEIPAGKHSKVILQKGECARIMTGAPVPGGADTVFMIEYHEMNADGMVSFKGHTTASNICLKGEDVKVGDLILEKGKLLKPHEIAILAGAGKERVKVYKQPAVAVLSTGAELVEPGRFPVNGQIRNSNGPQMMAQLAEMGIRASYEGIAPDEKINLRLSIEKALEKCDVLFISGGVSVGDYDFVPRIMKELGFDILITTISTKPGKHTIFAVKEGKYVLGFPGNPVSSYVQLELIGKTLLYQLMGHEWKPRRYAVTTANDYNRKGTDRLEFIPVNITGEGQAALIAYHGSAHIGALAGAHALMEIPIGVQSFKQGDKVYVRPL